MKLRLASVFLLLSTAALAGCSDAPPSGEFSLAGSRAVAEGTVTIEVHPFEDPLDIAQGDPDHPTCDNRPDLGAAGQDVRCRPPYTIIEVLFSADGLSQPDPAAGYTVVATGTPEGDLEIGDLAQNTTSGEWSVTNNFSADLTDAIGAIELRMGDVLVATAPGTAGSPQSFELAPAMTGVTAEGSYRGKRLDVEVNGLQGNFTGVGWLVSVDEETGAATHEVSFEVQNGEVSYTAERNIAEFSEFHIHVGDSKINLGIATL